MLRDREVVHSALAMWWRMDVLEVSLLLPEKKEHIHTNLLNMFLSGFEVVHTKNIPQLNKVQGKNLFDSNVTKVVWSLSHLTIRLDQPNFKCLTLQFP